MTDEQKTKLQELQAEVQRLLPEGERAVNELHRLLQNSQQKDQEWQEIYFRPDGEEMDWKKSAVDATDAGVADAGFADRQRYKKDPDRIREEEMRAQHPEVVAARAAAVEAYNLAENQKQVAIRLRDRVMELDHQIAQLQQANTPDTKKRRLDGGAGKTRRRGLKRRHTRYKN